MTKRRKTTKKRAKTPKKVVEPTRPVGADPVIQERTFVRKSIDAVVDDITAKEKVIMVVKKPVEKKQSEPTENTVEYWLCNRCGHRGKLRGGMCTACGKYQV